MSQINASPSGLPDNSRKIYVNRAYVRSLHGILKLIHMGLGLLTFILLMVTPSPFPSLSSSNFISFVTLGGFWTSAVLLFLYVINAVSFIIAVPWVLVELTYTGIWAFFYLVSGSLAADMTSRYVGTGAMGAVAFFAFITMVVYIYNAYLMFKLHREGVKLVITTEVTTGTSVTTNSA